jgi:hypothetical protein
MKAANIINKEALKWENFNLKYVRKWRTIDNS